MHRIAIGSAFALALTGALVSGCLSVEAPEGRLACTTAEECPDGWFCRPGPSGGRCFRTDGTDGGTGDAPPMDVGPIDAPDIGPVDVGPIDAPPLPDVPMDGFVPTDGPANPVLTIELAGGGLGEVGGALSCTSSPCTMSFPSGTMITLVATPDVSSTFGGWTGGCTGAADCAFTLTSDTTVTATFALRSVHLEVSVATGVGTVTSTAPASAMIDCAAGSTTGCSADLTYGDTVTLHPAGIAPYVFAGWSGAAACMGVTGDCTFDITEDTTLGASFSDGRPILGVTIVGNGNVTSDVTGIECAPDCSEPYDSGTIVTLTAIPASGSRFVSWTGCPGATGSTCAVTLAATTTVTATFEPFRYTLDVELNGTGAVTSTVGPIDCPLGSCSATNVDHGTMVTLVATPAAGWSFSDWSGVSGCTGATCDFAITANTTVTARFVRMTRRITVALTGEGQVFSLGGEIDCSRSGSTTTGTCMADVPVGDTLELRALSAGGYTFDDWSTTFGLTCTGTGTTCDLDVTGNGTVTAAFMLNRYDLGVTVTAAPGSSGTVGFSSGTVSSCSGTAAGATCTNNYVHGTTVTLTATAGATTTFAGWGGACTGTVGTSCMVTMLAAATVTASFVVTSDSLNVTTTGASTGTVASTVPDGRISCGATCNAMFTSGTSVTLTATPTANHQFDGWGGACAAAGTATTCMVTISGPTNVSATFSLVPRTLTTNLSGSGTVSDGAAFSCSTGSCMATYPHGTAVTLTATPDASTTFSSWSGACTGSGSCVLAMTANRNVTATFVPRTYPVSVSPIGSGSGTIMGTGISCSLPAGGSNDCDQNVNHGTSLVLTANVSAGSTFAGWGGDCAAAGTATTCTLMNITGARDVTATFTLATHTLTVTSPTGGMVRDSTPGSTINCPGDCTQAYPSGTLVTLDAIPASGYRFGGWSDSACGASPSCSFTMTAARSISATWIRVATVTVRLLGSHLTDGIVSSGMPPFSCSGSGSGSCTPLVVDVGTSVTFTASTRSGAPAWVGVTSWTGATPVCMGPVCTLNVTGDVTLSATFGQLGLLAFVTGATYTGALSGLTGADTSCNTAATAAGLPGTYTAWLSSSTTSALSRIPAAASGWVRVDGRPFAPSRADLGGALTRFPLNVTESGATVSTALVWTNTGANGSSIITVPGNVCADWASSNSANTARSGSTGYTGNEWTDAGVTAVTTCNTRQRLYCLQTNPTGTYAPVMPPPRDPSAIVMFSIPGVTGTYSRGDSTLSTLDGACQAAATAAGLLNTYVAFVSTSTTGARDRSRLGGPVFRPDGWRVISDVDDFESSTAVLDTSLAISATGAMLPNNRAAWTGFPAGGAATMNATSAETCSNWASATTTGVVGNPRGITPDLYGRASTTTLCTVAQTIYCIRYDN